ncbi:MAG TPA: DUF6458 family protein [Solirubrobacteraceae bacterium]|nr:DUF6458 family protein [Solirubrobacteraceae bacterium]
MTTVSWSLFLIAVGAILKWAITGHVEGIDLQTTGVILMVIGAIGLCIGMFVVVRDRSGKRAR